MLILGLIIVFIQFSIVTFINAFIFDSLHFLDIIFGLDLTLIQTWKLFFMIGALMFQMSNFSIWLSLKRTDIKGE